MIEVAKTAAKQAGNFVMEHFGNLKSEAVRKKSQNDFLSFVDENSEKKIVKTIHETYPDHAILAEEFGEIKNDSHYKWIIDPLDGTTNFISGIPFFAISLALEHRGRIILGVIYDPVHDDLFYAEAGKGAYLNGHAINVSEKDSLSESFLATGFPFKSKHLLPDYLNAFESIFRECIGSRRIGAAALDIAYVAAGRFEGFWELGLKPWDIAAGSIIVKEAGGIVTDFWNKPYYLYNSFLLASNGKIHQQVLTKIQQYFPFYKPVSS